jgi:SAM-dependent methyltransferase
MLTQSMETKMRTQNDEIREAVRKAYGEVANSGNGCGCGSGDNPTPENISVGLGYSNDDVSSVPDGANMGLGCGNPQAIASLQPGETVVDLGSGGGFDCFLAARAVGKNGHVIGIDMTPKMISKARKNALKTGLDNVEFRLGEIENLPVSNNEVDVIISNCVINLSPDKKRVFAEAYRVLKNGGRLAIADIVAISQLPDEIKSDLALHSGCVAGAQQVDELRSLLEELGFTNISIKPRDGINEFVQGSAPGSNFEDFIASASIEAVKPE